jgi:hypothetical protein
LSVDIFYIFQLYLPKKNQKAAERERTCGLTVKQELAYKTSPAGGAQNRRWATAEWMLI